MQGLSVEELTQVSRAFGKTFGHEKQDLDTYCLSARLVIRSALAAAAEDTNDSFKFSNVALFTSYNLSAGCWPAWDEGAYGIPQDKLDLGLSAAEFNIELADQLEVGPEKRKNGHWIRGAHLAAQKRFDEAKQNFATGQILSEEAGDQDAMLMCEGWVALMDQLRGETAAAARLTEIKLELAQRGEDGAFYAAQFDPFLGYLASS